MYKSILISSADNLSKQFEPRPGPPRQARSWGYKTFFMLNSAEHEICWHFNIYEHDKYNIWKT